MKPRLKKLKDQVIVITGATSGIGLVTARSAVKGGARVVLSARNEEALRQLTDEINASGGQAAYCVADVGRQEDVRRLADTAISRFGGFDTWVNDAGISIFGRNEDVPIEDHKRLFDTNYWGVVHGSLIAVEHLRSRGGALINMGSVLSERSVPIQGAYSASKHAVKAFTDSLRMELEQEGAPISITLIKPTSIDTPFTWHARSYMGADPALPPPVYDPQAVADTILYCAQHPVRDVYVGSAAKAFSAAEKFAPRTTDLVMEKTMFRMQKAGQQRRKQEDSLDRPTRDLSERGGNRGPVFKRSLYTKASLHPAISTAVAIGAAGLAVIGAVAAGLSRESRTSRMSRSLKRAARSVRSSIGSLT